MQSTGEDFELGPDPKKARMDTSIDTSAQRVAVQAETVRKSQTRAVANEYGNTQGPAGEALPEDPSISGNRSAPEEVSNFSLGVVGPSDRTPVDVDLEGADAALYAADRAQKRGSSDDAVLDALEAAEAEYNASHPADQGKKLPGRAEESLNGSTSMPGSPRGISRSTSGFKGSLNIDESTRQKVRDRIVAGLNKNPNFGKGKQKVEEVARTCEEKCFDSCSSRTVYFSKAGNAARLAASLPAVDLEELPRIASGEAKQVSNSTASTNVTAADSTVTGLQGTVIKPVDRTSGI